MSRLFCGCPDLWSPHPQCARHRVGESSMVTSRGCSAIELCQTLLDGPRLNFKVACSNVMTKPYCTHAFRILRGGKSSEPALKGGSQWGAESSLNQGVLPGDWQTAKVVPIHNIGVKRSPFNYWPISLLSISCNISEHIIFSKLASFLDSNYFFTSAPHGFRKHYSCEMQLIYSVHSLHTSTDHRSQADIF